VTAARWLATGFLVGWVAAGLLDGRRARAERAERKPAAVLRLVPPAEVA